MKNRTVSLALALLTAFAPAAACVPEGIREASAVYAAEDIQLTAAEVALPAYPRAGETPDPAGCTVTAGRLESVRWIDMAEKRELTEADSFKEGHVCSFSAYILAPDGAVWASTPDGRPSVKVTCRAGDRTWDALSVIFNQNPDGSVTLLAVFTFTVAGAEDEEKPGDGENPETPPEPGEPAGPEKPGDSGSKEEEKPGEGNTVSSVMVRGARIPAEGQKMQVTGFDASPCMVRDAGWYNVTDNAAMELGETFIAGKEYCVSLFLLPPEGKNWAPDARVRLILTDGEEVTPVRSFISMGGDGVVVLIGDFILTAVTEAEAAEREANAVQETPAENPPADNPPAENPPAENPPSENPPAGEDTPFAEEPSDLTAAIGDTVVFRAALKTAAEGWVCRWIAVNGEEIIPLSDGAFGYGSTLCGPETGVLTLAGAAKEMNGVRFACVFIGPAGETVGTRHARLSVLDPDAPPLFHDTAKTAWYYPSVEKAVELGLMNGRGGGLYEPEGTVTFAETVKLAAVIRELCETGSVTLKNGDPWYATYVDYADAMGILTDGEAWGMISAGEALRRANEPVTRSEFAWIFSRALPKEALAVVNDIPEGSIPDLYPDGGEVNVSPERQNAVYALYRAGILNGSDAYGTFRPWAEIRRSEVAAIAVRMCVPGERVGAPEMIGRGAENGEIAENEG